MHAALVPAAPCSYRRNADARAQLAGRQPRRPTAAQKKGSDSDPSLTHASLRAAVCALSAFGISQVPGTSQKQRGIGSRWRRNPQVHASNPNRARAPAAAPAAAAAPAPAAAAAAAAAAALLQVHPRLTACSKLCSSDPFRVEAQHRRPCPRLSAAKSPCPNISERRSLQIAACMHGQTHAGRQAILEPTLTLTSRQLVPASQLFVRSLRARLG